jgi:flap endonuclease-1
LCKESLTKIHFSSLRNKKLAIDISIYLYKYQSENTLIENIYLMISLFRKYDIIPVFIFDGKPPAEKKDLLMARNSKKKEAELNYNNLKKKLEDDISEDEKQFIIDEMESERKNFIRIKQKDIEEVKNLIRLYGVTYYDAPGEAEELCALLVKKGIVDGCVSEDMDLFLYGCNKVYRYLSLATNTLVYYDTNNILKTLKCSLDEFRIICILSGTDYYNFDLGNLYKCFHIHSKFLNNKNDKSFLDWLVNNKIILNKDDVNIIHNIVDIFNYSNLTVNKKHIDNSYICKNINFNRDNLKNYMKNYGFIYLNK